MKILLTGDQGFVGRHIQTSLTADGHTVIGIEAEPHFDKWIGKFHCSKHYDLILNDIEAVVHAGAIATNQFDDPSIFIWNSYATLILAKYLRDRFGTAIPFVFFSTFQVTATEEDKRRRSWYGWSKAFAEECLREVLPGATILRPGVMWGDETHKKNIKDRSIPYQLATHQLKYLYENWGRDYVHINDVVEAVKIAIRDKPGGTFNLNGEYWWNKDLMRLTDWNDYELVADPAGSLGVKFTAPVLPEHMADSVSLPNWKIQSCLQAEFESLECKYGIR